MSEATLLNMLGISPFTYGLVVTKVYDSGSIFDPTILDITDEDLKAHVLAGIRNIAALSLKIGYPTIASVPHSIINGMKTFYIFRCQGSKDKLLTLQFRISLGTPRFAGTS